MYTFSYLEPVCCSMSSSNCCFLTCIQVSYLFQNFPQFIVIHTVKGFGIVNKAEIDVFLELSRFFDDPVDVGNLISGSSAFSKTSLNIWKLAVHVLLKPGLENSHHNCMVYLELSDFYEMIHGKARTVCPISHEVALEVVTFGKTNLQNHWNRLNASWFRAFWEIHIFHHQIAAEHLTETHGKFRD